MSVFGGARPQRSSNEGPIPELLYALFTEGIRPALRSEEPGARELRHARFFAGPNGLHELWQRYRDRVMTRWQREHPSSERLPWAALNLDKPCDLPGDSEA